MPKNQQPKRFSQKQQLANDMARIVALLKLTKEQLGKAHPFFDDADTVLDKITPDNPAAGIVAIHFVSIATAELLSKRDCAARISLVAALGLVEERMHATLLDFFEPAFVPNRPENAPPPMPPVMEQIVQALLNGQGVFDEDGQCPVPTKGKGKKKAGKALPPTNPFN